MRFVHLTVLLVVCVLVARTAASLTEASLWTPPGTGQSAAPATEVTPRPILNGARLASLLQLEERPLAGRPRLSTTEAPLTLLGTLAPAFACVVDQTTGAVRTVAPGDTVAGAEIVSIARGMITLRRGGALEELHLRAGSGASPKAPTPSTALARSELMKVVENFPELAQKLRVVPRVTDGRFDGFALFGLAQVPVLSASGLQDGDVIHRVNGIDTSRPDQLLALVGQLPALNRVEVEFTRKGVPLRHAISLQ
ncbi:MAG: hypothetical protein AB1938_14090 [Myxococcota bacterium]